MLSGVVLGARVLLAGVFAVAAVSKAADRHGTRSAVVAFGAPAWSAATLALALPLAELAVAALLLPSSTAVAGAAGAVLLVAVFTAVLARNLARGRAPDCHCFGQLHSAPASWRTLARNGLLLAIAVLALAGSVAEEPLSATGWVADLSTVELLAVAAAGAAVAVAAAAAAALVSLVRSYGRVLVRLERVEAVLARAGLSAGDELELPEIGLAPGTTLPPFASTTLAGAEISPDTLAASGLPALLLFTSPRCGPCGALMPTVAEWQRDHADRLTVIVASSGAEEEARAEAERHGLDNALHDADGRLAELFQANGTPSAVLVAPDGTIGSWVAAGSEWIEQLVEHALGSGDEGGLPIGTEAPALELETLAGETMSLAALRGRESVLLFWNPDCGYCRSMHDDLLAWEASANGVTPRLVVVSSGDAESTLAEGFRSLVLLDEDFAAGAAFAANGTPMAVLVDADGRIASPVAAGADAVLALADGQR